ncbi:hypothetical protein Pla52n_53740 [Stieleria varia]|uniref:Uncharacterized protein n=1 Tax=Stieleria varia TaxID=2528005 RepID=A0A5C6A8D2_9BACT|nr:hypothetical protein Pla52n_53740 [Stieleria varia]
MRTGRYRVAADKPTTISDHFVVVCYMTPSAKCNPVSSGDHLQRFPESKPPRVKFGGPYFVMHRMIYDRCPTLRADICLVVRVTKVKG